MIDNRDVRAKADEVFKMVVDCCPDGVGSLFCSHNVGH